MEKNNMEVIKQLDIAIKELEDLIKNIETKNEILKLNIQKKELILQSLELEETQIN